MPSKKATKKPRPKKQEAEAVQSSESGFKLAEGDVPTWQNVEPVVVEVTEVPKCGVVIKKTSGDAGVPCPEDAKYVIQMTDPDDPYHIKVTGVLFLCERHSQKFDNGTTLLVKDAEGNMTLSSGKSIVSGDTLKGHNDAS